MNIQYEKILKNNSYSVTIGVESIDDAYTQAIFDYGEDYINLGGKIMTSETTPTILVELPNIDVKLTELALKPITQQFPEAIYKATSADIATKWCEFAIKVITDYKVAMVAKVDTFSKKDTIVI